MKNGESRHRLRVAAMNMRLRVESFNCGYEGGMEPCVCVFNELGNDTRKEMDFTYNTTRYSTSSSG